MTPEEKVRAHFAKEGRTVMVAPDLDQQFDCARVLTVDLYVSCADDPGAFTYLQTAPTEAQAWEWAAERIP